MVGKVALACCCRKTDFRAKLSFQCRGWSQNLKFITKFTCFSDLLNVRLPILSSRALRQISVLHCVVSISTPVFWHIMCDQAVSSKKLPQRATLLSLNIHFVSFNRDILNRDSHTIITLLNTRRGSWTFGCAHLRRCFEGVDFVFGRGVFNRYLVYLTRQNSSCATGTHDPAGTLSSNPLAIGREPSKRHTDRSPKEPLDAKARLASLCPSLHAAWLAACTALLFRFRLTGSTAQIRLDAGHQNF